VRKISLAASWTRLCSLKPFEPLAGCGLKTRGFFVLSGVHCQKLLAMFPQHGQEEDKKTKAPLFCQTPPETGAIRPVPTCPKDSKLFPVAVVAKSKSTYGYVWKCGIPPIIAI